VTLLTLLTPKWISDLTHLGVRRVRRVTCFLSFPIISRADAKYFINTILNNIANELKFTPPHLELYAKAGIGFTNKAEDRNLRESAAYKTVMMGHSRRWNYDEGWRYWTSLYESQLAQMLKLEKTTKEMTALAKDVISLAHASQQAE